MIMLKMQKRKLPRKFYKIKIKETSKLIENNDTNIKAKNMNESFKECNIYTLAYIPIFPYYSYLQTFPVNKIYL